MLGDFAICASCSQPFDKFIPKFMETIPEEVRVILTCVNYLTPHEYPNLVKLHITQKTFSRGRAINAAIWSNKRLNTILADVDFVFHEEYWDALLKKSPMLDKHFFSAYICRMVRALNEKDIYEFPIYFRDIYSANNPFVCRTDNLLAVGGYDERMVGWGAEDDDLRDRLIYFGLTNYRLPIVVFHKEHKDIILTDYYEHKKNNRAIWLANIGKIESVRSQVPDAPPAHRSHTLRRNIAKSNDVAGTRKIDETPNLDLPKQILDRIRKLPPDEMKRACKNPMAFVKKMGWLKG